MLLAFLRYFLDIWFVFRAGIGTGQEMVNHGFMIRGNHT
jgi:hypothetical protein